MQTRRKTRKSWDEEGHAHFLTFSCYKRLPLLAEPEAKDTFLLCLDAARTRLGFQVWAYVVMPEHVHLLVFPGPGGATIARILQSVKQPVSRRLMKTSGLPKFWQPGGGYDRNIVSDPDIMYVLDYMHNNPVERQLASTPEEYPWSSACWYLDQTGPFQVDTWTR